MSFRSADRLGHPPTRWRAHAALGRALDAARDDEAAAEATRIAASIIRGFATTLRSEHAETVLGSPAVQEILSA